MTEFACGFEDATEVSEIELQWEGCPPSWLQGSLFRNGPGRYNRGEVEVSHWFDGLALLHGFHIRPNGVTYRSRYIRSHDFRVSQLDGRIASPGFSCDPCRTLFRKIASVFVVDATDNPNVSLIKQGNRFLALTELPIPMEFDPHTLRTKSPHRYRDSLPAGSTTAHPHQEGDTLFNLILHYSATPSYRLYRQHQLEPRVEFTRVKVGDVSYVHSFGLSRDSFILTCCPFQVAPWKLLTRDKPFIENFLWKPETGTRFHVAGRTQKSTTQTLTTEPFFCFHHVNSFEGQDGRLQVDLVAYPNANIIQQLKLEHLRGPDGIDFGRLRRYTLDLESGEISRAWESQHALELPRIHYRKCNTKPYRYVFGVSADRQASSFYDRLIKLDVTCDEATYWREPSTFPGEPVFVPREADSEEDDGVVLSVVLSGTEERSFLLILDARSFEEIARAWLPCTVPHGFHGLFEGV
jgi:beta,beta-carotene 9',10'-dioxygenase